MNTGKKLTGTEADAAVLRARAMEIIGKVLEIPVMDLRKYDARRDWLAPPPIQAFKRIDPVMLLGNADWWIYQPEEYTPAIIWPIDVTTISVSPFGDQETLMMQNFRTVTPKDVRGYASRISPFMVRRNLAVVDRGEWVTASGLQSYFGGKWVEASKKTNWEGRDADTAIPTRGNATVGPNERRHPALAMGIALRHRYEWAVSMGFANAPTVRFSTDPTGVKELFRLREVPDGKNKRDALLNWVSDHWRKSRNDPEMETYVRKHMRGTTRFEWRGFECELLPSQFDMEHKDRLIAERQKMKAMGDDKRVA